MYFAKIMACAAAVLIAVPAAAEELRQGGKLLLTNGVTTIEGASGGGISTWALIAGNETTDGIGGSAHVSIVVLPDYDWQSHGAAIGLFDRVELSYARQNFNTRDIGAALGIGQDYVLRQDVFGAKVRLFGDAVYGSPWAPQVAVGVQHKRNLDGWVARAVGAKETEGTDFYVAATKLSLSTSILVGATARLTKANQNGLLGFGGDKGEDYSVQFEGTLGYQLSRRFVIGGEYRTKPDNLGVAREDDWFDLYAAYAITRNLTATAAYADLGSIATVPKQRGAFLSLQASF
ncbi:DUF3034 family protein [Sphingomonas gilva]|uniref:DUF3034 family protein n=1 Tax=Sphingomonas gilva TaxID=2305907 RepID=A0A396RSX9_9SPHN|nr:DUF3034 family protein [Sphingomonas gilva]RHW16721.1 DUF3034 family protein [Sphingomonas gilva]